ncbi:hypothetical protein C8J57DRAFT_1229480 [Mycena rebaudengoi]|nr:hypothetical protein C8J57DRAFT_1229480 [Mycena rebaudengoi]
MEHIHEILCIIIQLHSTSEIKGVLPTAILYNIVKFTDCSNSEWGTKGHSRKDKGTVLTASGEGEIGIMQAGVEPDGWIVQELQDVVNILLQDSAHIAILGTGGMGKTSLATTALHNQEVEAKYSH